MEMKQISSLLNEVNKETLGEDVIVTEDLGNIADIGTAVFNANSFDHYVRTLVDRIGKSVFVNRKYNGRVPSVLMDGWEYGAVLAKYSAELPETTENESWELSNGTSVDPNVVTLPEISARFYNKRVTFEVPITIVEKQFRSAFTSASECASFIAMIFNAIENRMRISLDNLIMRAINNMIGETIYADYGANAVTGGSHVKAVNVLYLYNQLHSDDPITASEMSTNPEFIRFANNIMFMYVDRLASASTLFNIDGKVRFTPNDKLHFVVLSEFDAGSKAYLESDTYHDVKVELPKHEVVPFWQGSGSAFAFSDTSKINITTASGHNVEVGGILGVMFDTDAVAVTNMDRRTTANYNGKGEFTNNWFKMDAGYLNSLQENFVVFFGASA